MSIDRLAVTLFVDSFKLHTYIDLCVRNTDFKRDRTLHQQPIYAKYVFLMCVHIAIDSREGAQIAIARRRTIAACLHIGLHSIYEAQFRGLSTMAGEMILRQP
ncbi:uncharacterized protein LOC143154717 isoform X2 [Ptiloglossa arizonensis]|uniref:uncharacterized protein LOC143154717 isoform X2 n=1 Tax=Ptiloglossa arizonensis TaxID=3350558 RepID=UPI003FA09ED8